MPRPAAKRPRAHPASPLRRPRRWERPIANADVSPTVSAEVGAGAQLKAGDDISVTAKQ